MTEGEIQILASLEVRKLLKLQEGHPPEKFALTYKGSFPTALIATQLKLRSKAKEKLPDFLKADCIFETESLEQSSSEAAAKMKNWGKGELALDLTLGLGVDASFIAKNYSRVIAIEPDPLKVALASFNFSTLGIKNIEILCSTAESFLQQDRLEIFDLVYLDPSRRSKEGKRKFSPAENDPDFFRIAEELKKISKRILLKTSPMFDIDEALRLFKDVHSVSVISIGNQVREVLYEFIPGTNEEIQYHIHLEQLPPFSFNRVSPYSETIIDFAEPLFILEPDPAFYKAGKTGQLFGKYFPEIKGGMNHPTGYFFSASIAENFPGRTFRILECLPYKPSKIRAVLKAKGESSVNFLRRNFDIPLPEIHSQINLKEGGSLFLVFSKMKTGERMAYITEMMPKGK